MNNMTPRYSPDRMVSEDRIVLGRIGPNGLCRGSIKHCQEFSDLYYKMGFIRDQEDVDELTWVSRRREQHGWRNGAKVGKRS